MSGPAVFRLTQISDTHLSRAPRFARLADNFHRVCEHINAAKPDLVINSGDVTWDAPSNPDDLAFAKSLHAGLPVACRYLPGNHDIGDNPTMVGKPPPHPSNEKDRSAFVAAVGEDRFQFEAAGWRFIGLNSLIMNSGLGSETEQMDWLAKQLSDANGKPIALFLHKPLFLDTPGDPETESTAVRYVPQPVRAQLVKLFDAYDVRLVASGHIHQRRDFTYGRLRHVWAPSVGFTLPDRIQPGIGKEETGFVEYQFRPDSFEIHHLRAHGQLDIGLDDLLA